MSAVLEAPIEAKRGQPKSAERAAVELAMQQARVPLDSRQLASRTGADVDKVRKALGNLVQEHKAHRLPPLPGERLHRYALGAEPYVMPAPRREKPGGDYLGHELRPYTARPGAMHAFQLPSLHNGAPIERRPPMLLGSTKPDARAR